MIKNTNTCVPREKWIELLPSGVRTIDRYFAIVLRVRSVRAFGEPPAVFDFACEWEDCIENARGRDAIWVACTPRRPRVPSFAGDGVAIGGRFRR
jgi:hypothetical protein